MMLPAPFVLEQRGRIDSSNDEARRLAQQGAGHGTVVSAVEQTAGRGRRGRVWMSPSGNLHCSILLDPGPDPVIAPQLTFVAAVALRDALAELAVAADFRVKWPNDLLCGGAKIAGMLLEQAGRLVVLGVGVNVAAHPEIALYPATSLRKTGSGATADDVLAGFCRQLARRYDQWRSQGFAPIRAAWLEMAAGKGENLIAKLADETERQGVFEGLAADGALELTGTDGVTHRIFAGDVFFNFDGGRDAAGN
jgi:BirA family biotin operon repressor/biotin-[acetyl-CoA-carboxylase] ligase